MLELEDLELVDPGRGGVLTKLQSLVTKKGQIMSDEALDDDTKAEVINSLTWMDALWKILASPSSTVLEVQYLDTRYYIIKSCWTPFSSNKMSLGC